MATTWITELESGVSGVPSSVSAEEGKAYFERVRELLASDVTRARRLAEQWRLVAKSSVAWPWALRTRAVLERLDGKWLTSAKTFLRAAAQVADPVEALEFQIGAIDSLGRSGRVSQAVELGLKLSRGLSQAGRQNDAGRASLNTANSLLWHDRYPQAVAQYDLALQTLDQDDPMVGSAWLGLSTAELFGGHPKKAADAAERAATLFAQSDSAAFEALARMNIGHAHLMTGALDQALDTFLSVRGQVEATSAEAGRLEEFLGDVFLRLNMLPEAEHAYQTAASIQSTGLNRANAWFGLGQVFLLQDRFTEARAQFVRAEVAYKQFGNEVWAAASLTARARALRRLGETSSASRLTARAVKRLQHHRSPYHLALAWLERAECEIAKGRDPVTSLRKAGSLVTRHAYQGLQWRIHAIRAEATQEPGCFRHYRRMLDECLTSRALVSSLNSRATFYLDKSAAISSYVGRLLDRPNRARVAEALEVIRKARSVALLEEIVGSQKRVPQSFLDELSGLRDEINAALSTEGQTGGSRRLRPQREELTALQRRWIELTRAVSGFRGLTGPSSPAPDLVFAETPAGLFAISREGVGKLPVRASELERTLKLLRFELLEPMLQPEATGKCLEEATSKLRNQLTLDLPGHVQSICPEGVFWQVPWALLGVEAVLSTGPWVGQEGVHLPKAPRAVVWYQDHIGLHHIKKEVDVFLTKFPEAKVCQSLAEVRQSMNAGEIDLLHVATHARFHASNPFFSYLSFDGGVVTGAEIARSNLRAGLVCLSACETGMVSNRVRGEPEGLVRGFLSRGATRVVASSWALDDRSAEIFAYTFYNALVKGDEVSNCVRQARFAVRSRFDHPYYWGPFTLFGGYTPS